MFGDITHTIIVAAIATIAPVAHAESVQDAHFSLDLITISIAQNPQPAFAWDFEAPITQSAAAQSDTGALPPVELLILVSGQGNQSSGFDLANITNSGNPSGSTDIDGTRFTPKEDNLNVVPLPPAAFVGLGMLAGIAGVRHLRNNQR